jgi:uncharacterized repeat protein (TIGR04042 family)
MPEMHFRIRWPDGRRDRCYSPSLVVKDHLETGQSYALAEFVRRCVALEAANERVKVRYGRPCPRALGGLTRIEATSRVYSGADARVRADGFEDRTRERLP